MPASYGKKDKGKATRLHSKLVRAMHDFQCQRCGRTPADDVQLHCAHIISRHVVATRVDETNAFCLCASCHFFFGKWPVEFAKFVFDKIGSDEYERLFKIAQEGIGKKVDWASEVDRLEMELRQYDSN
jgi:5-methylcytosine-specific restriction endonuclease McrA